MAKMSAVVTSSRCCPSRQFSQRAADLIDTLALSHSMRPADVLIGATALEHDLTLLTANTKHFGAVEGLQVEAFVP